MMNDLSKLADSFEALGADLFGISKRTGAKLEKLDSAMYWPGPEANVLARIRAGMFKMLASSTERRLSFQHRATKWPLTPQNSCNTGFLISSTGYGIGYFAGCGCLSSFIEDPTNFRALMVNGAGEYFGVTGYPCQQESGEFVRLGTSNGYLVKFDIPREVSAQDVLLGDVHSPGEPVYSLGVNVASWVMSEGIYLPQSSDAETISTTCDCFHGFCGAPLFKADGTIVGLGASIRFDDGKSDDAIPNRKYGFSSFDRLSSILTDIPAEASSQLRWKDN